MVSVSTAWEPEQPPPWSWGSVPRLAGSRLAEFGASSVPVRSRLFTVLTQRARSLSDCQQLARWPFSTNVTALVHCDFNKTGNLLSENIELVLYVLGEDERNTKISQLRQCAREAGIALQVLTRSRANFNITSVDRSFLFLDYDLWQGVPGLSVVEPPSTHSQILSFTNFLCKLELDDAIAMRVADVEILQTHAPNFFHFIYDFNPSLESLRFILERQASGVDIEEAACETALAAKSYSYDTKYDRYKYSVLMCICNEDPNFLAHVNITKIVARVLDKQTSKFGFDINLHGIFINCSDTSYMSNKLRDVTRLPSFHRLLGVLSMAVEGVAAASATAAANHVPLMLADVVPEDDMAEPQATWRVAPRPRHFARALLHFVRESRWTRVAVLSQPTKLAKDYYDALNDGTEIILSEYSIPVHITDQEAQRVINDLKNVNARIVFVNADSQAAGNILTAAVAAHMGYADGYVWILRDWQQNHTVACGTVHFTVSSWIRGVKDIPPKEGSAALHRIFNQVMQGHPWPPRSVSLVDALLSLVLGYKDVFQRMPDMRQDLHNGQMIRSLEESLIRSPVKGVSQQLRFKDRSIEETLVFVDQWCGGNFKQRLARWRVNATNGAVREANAAYASYTPLVGFPVDDGIWWSSKFIPNS